MVNDSSTAKPLFTELLIYVIHLTDFINGSTDLIFLSEQFKGLFFTPGQLK